MKQYVARSLQQSASLRIFSIVFQSVAMWGIASDRGVAAGTSTWRWRKLYGVEVVRKEETKEWHQHLEIIGFLDMEENHSLKRGRGI
jgi:hypothetical protein